MVGCKIHDMTQPVTALWRETDVAPICAMAAERRARAIKIFPGLKTWIETLGQDNHTSRRQAWMASSSRWLKTLENRHQRVIDGEGDGGDKEEGGSSSVAGVRWAGYERTKQRDAASPYLDSKYGETMWASLKKIPVRNRPEQVRLGQGLRLLSLCRVGGLWTAVKRAKRGLIANKYLKICLCCED